MKLLAAAIGAILLTVSPAFAQKSTTQLSQEIQSTFPDQTSGAITPAGTRTFLSDVVNSLYVAGTSCPSSVLSGYQPWTNTTGAPTATLLTVFDGTQCVPWGTLNQSTHTIGTSFSSVVLNGSASGSITIAPQAATGTYNFNLPTSAGTIGAALLSGGGGSSPMTWTAGALAIVSGKTFTANNSLTLSGTDGTTFTFPGASDTVVGLAATQTLTNKTLTGATISGAAISGGTINNTSMGAVTPNSGVFTSLTATSIYSGLTILTGTSGTITVTTTIFNGSGSFTATLPSASTNGGQILFMKNITANAVVSASSNVVPLAGGAAGTALLAATAGKFVTLVSDGTNWQIMAGN